MRRYLPGCPQCSSADTGAGHSRRTRHEVMGPELRKRLQSVDQSYANANCVCDRRTIESRDCRSRSTAGSQQNNSRPPSPLVYFPILQRRLLFISLLHDRTRSLLIYRAGALLILDFSGLRFLQSSKSPAFVTVWTETV